MYIAIAGNIGCGKTSFVEMFSKEYDLMPYYENIDNPYLNDFYSDMKQWSFKLQISFLANKVTQMRSIAKEDMNVIQDRTVFEEAMVFVKNLNNMLLMSKRDYTTYLRIYNLLLEDISKPDLLIYLKSDVPTLVANIKKRGRVFEQNIQHEYLEKLNELYDDWFYNEYKGPKIVINIDELDFIEKEEDFKEMTSIINSEINKLGLVF